MAKEVKNNDNSLGVASVVLAILSIVLASVNGLILGITALFFAKKQNKLQANEWARAGKILAIIGVILSNIATIVSFYYFGGLYGLQ